MDRKEKFISCQQIGWHKGFYHDEKLVDALCKVHFEDFLELPDDDEYIIRQMSEDDINELKKDDRYFDIALDFAVAVIEEYSEFYKVKV